MPFFIGLSLVFLKKNNCSFTKSQLVKKMYIDKLFFPNFLIVLLKNINANHNMG